MRTNLAFLSSLAVLSASATASRAQAAPPNAEPGRRLVVLEASVDRSVFQTFGADGDFRLCLANTNPFSNPDLGLLPGDRLVLMIPTACGELGATCAVSAAAASLDADGFGCVAFADQVEVEDQGEPAALGFQERICVEVSFESSVPTSCASELLFPRHNCQGWTSSSHLDKGLTYGLDEDGRGGGDGGNPWAAGRWSATSNAGCGASRIEVRRQPRAASSMTSAQRAVRSGRAWQRST